MSQIIGVGIVGYGKVATGAHRRWATQREDARLAAVCDMTDVRRQAAAEDNPNAAIYENLIDACHGEAEPNVTPSQLRASMGLIDAIFESSSNGRLIDL